jgi:hypothetical protein
LHLLSLSNATFSKVASYQREKVLKPIQSGTRVSHILILHCNATLKVATLGIEIPGLISWVTKHSDYIRVHLAKTDGMLQVATTTTAAKTDRGDTRKLCGMEAVEMSIERSDGEAAKKQGGV